MRSTNHSLTVRDRAILRDLWLYRYLDSSQMTRLHFTNPQTTRRRLRRLLEGNLVDRFRPSSLAKEGFGQWAYRLTMAGARVVAEATEAPAKELGRPPRGERG